MATKARITARGGRDFIARHGETVFNAAGRLQGDLPHTSLTRQQRACAGVKRLAAALALAALAAPALLALAAPAGARDRIGIYKGWGAFRDARPPRCYAIAQPSVRPSVRGGKSRGWASVATWPERGLRGSLHIRLSRERDRSAGVTLSVGERRFALVANGLDAWAADAPSDRAIVTAIRSGRSMSVEAVGAGGQPFADTYALAGAATAIDAAALACAGR